MLYADLKRLAPDPDPINICCVELVYGDLYKDKALVQRGPIRKYH